MSNKDSRPALVLVSEARGEFAMVERMRRRLAEHGRPTIHVTAAAADVSEADLSLPGVVALDAHPAYREAATWPEPRLREEVAREQAAFGVNLRRMWHADFRSWRENVHDEQMARIAVGSLRAWSEILPPGGRFGGIWGEDGAHLVKQMGILVAESRGIPRWLPWATPLPGRVVVFDNDMARIDAEAFHATEPSPDEWEQAKRLIDGVRAGRQQFMVSRDMSLRPSRVANLMRLLYQRYLTKPPGSESLYPLTFARLYLDQRGTAAALRRHYRQIGERPFVFYPLHSARDTQISLRAPQWENQLALVEHLAASLPYGYELAIKEHPYEVGALPLRGLLSLLRLHPEIRLLDPRLHAQAVLPKADAVATVNSTTGFEALFLGKPLVTFGHSPYREIGLAYDVVDPFDTPRILLEALQRGPAPDDEVVRFVVYLYRRSAPGRQLSLDLGDENVHRYADLLAEVADAAERGVDVLPLAVGEVVTAPVGNRAD